MSEHLYFIAIIPPQDICDEITVFKNEMSELYQSKAALKIIPHITLKAPFKLAAPKHAGLFTWFEELYTGTESFEIELENFGAFHNKQNPVIFVHPVMNTALAIIQQEIVRSFHNHFPEINIMDVERKFSPHITIAYRDLQFEQFEQAWSIFRNRAYKASFTVNEIHLLEHDGKKWNSIQKHKIQFIQRYPTKNT